jgi:APA family basic amino acid/polyamine antiporter
VTINVFYIYAIPIPEMKGVVDIARRASNVLLGDVMSFPVSFMIILAILGSLNSVILTAPRIYFAMANDGLFPGPFGAAHPRFKTPHCSIAMQAAISCLMVMVGSFYQLLSYSVFFMLVGSIATAAGVFVIRRRKPFLKRPYRVWGYPFTTLFFVVSYAWIACRIFLYNPCNAIIGILITLSGIPFFIYWKKRRARNC